MPKLLRKKDVQKAKNINLKFLIDCTEPKHDKVLNLEEFAGFLKTKIKVNGKLGNLGEDVAVLVEGDKVAVTATVPFSKRYLKYLTKKYLQRETLKEFLYVSAVDKNSYKLKYFDVAQNEGQ